jgi:hypothetical protein
MKRQVFKGIFLKFIKGSLELKKRKRNAKIKNFLEKS